MRKIQKFSELQPTIGFTEFDIYRDYQKSFAHTELGKIHALFPFTALAKEWGLCEHSVGRHAYFSAEGKIALMVGLHCAFGQCADCAVKFQYPLSTLLRHTGQPHKSINQLQDRK